MTKAGIRDVDDLHLVFDEGEGKALGLPLLDTVQLQKALRGLHATRALVRTTEEVRPPVPLRSHGRRSPGGAGAAPSRADRHAGRGQTRRRLLADELEPYTRQRDLERMLRKDLIYGPDFVRPLSCRPLRSHALSHCVGRSFSSETPGEGRERHPSLREGVLSLQHAMERPARWVREERVTPPGVARPGRAQSPDVGRALGAFQETRRTPRAYWSSCKSAR
eukprot:scaffold1974_cov395-Prasinococcus_capsulatus_cf.AAC.5